MNRVLLGKILRSNIHKRCFSEESRPLKFKEIPYHLQYETRDFESKTIKSENIPKKLTIPDNISLELSAIINYDPDKFVFNNNKKDERNREYSNPPRTSPW
jgi:hypothetical protein